MPSDDKLFSMLIVGFIALIFGLLLFAVYQQYTVRKELASLGFVEVSYKGITVMVAPDQIHKLQADRKVAE